MRVNRSYKTNRERSKRSEKRAAKLFKGKVQPGSGCLPVAALKADVKGEEFLVDDKTTKHQSFSVTMKLWRKLSKEAWTINKKPALRLQFENDNVDLVVISAAALEELLERQA